MIMVNYNKKLSEVISFLRFPLAVLVVLIHATLVYELHNGVPLSYTDIGRHI